MNASPDVTRPRGGPVQADMTARPRLLALSLVTLAVLAVAAPAGARPLDVRRLPRGASAVIHLDVDGLRASPLFAALLAKLETADLELPPPMVPLVRAAIREVHGVSAWLGEGEHGAIVIDVGASAAVDGILAALPAAERRTLERWSVQKRTVDGDTSWLARLPGSVVVADSERSLLDTMRVLDGKAAGLDPARLPTLVRESGVLLFAVFDEKILAPLERMADARALKAGLSSLAVSLARRSSTFHLRASATVRDERAAAEIRSVIEGLRALGSLSIENEQIKALLRAATVTASGPRIEVAFAVPEADIARAIAAIDGNATGR